MGDHKLYGKELSQVYDEMYQSIFNYDEEYKKYETFMLKHKCKTVIEIGCGSGNVSKRFLKEKENFEYIGVDLSEDMIEIARRRCPQAKFIVGDMRKLNELIEKESIGKIDCIIITGRTYMTTNEDVLNCLRSIWKVLKVGGVLKFDNFNASNIFKGFKGKFSTEAKFETRKITRKSTTSWNLQNGFTWNWKSEYIIEEEGKEKKVIGDETILRAFLKEELTLFLEICGFEILEILAEDNNVELITTAKKRENMLPMFLN